MPVTHTNRKGVTYALGRRQTKTGATRYFFGRGSPEEPVEQIPDGFRISESPNGVVSLIKDRPSLIEPAEVAAVEAAIRRNPRAKHSRVVAKHNTIEIYERGGPDLLGIADRFRASGLLRPDLDVAALLAQEERLASFAPVLRFILVDPAQRLFRAERMCYLGRIDGWLRLENVGTAGSLARELIRKLGTDEFFELY